MRGRVGANTVKGVMASPPHPLRVALHSGHAYKGLFTRHRPLMLIAKTVPLSTEQVLFFVYVLVEIELFTKFLVNKLCTRLHPYKCAK